MPRARDILDAARAATVWLLMVVCMFLGPVSTAAAGPDGCGDACPCEQAAHDDPEHDAPVDEEECPEDCPGCHASPGVALTSFVVSSPRSPPSSSTHGPAPSDAAAVGVGSGVFRPPRS